MKIRFKISSFLSLFVIFILLFSCASTPVPMPGDQQKKITNIYIEYMNIAEEYYKLEKYDKAITYYKFAMQSRTLYLNCYYKLAKVYSIHSNWSNALDMYKTILKRDPENASIKSSIAYLYSMNGQNDKALKIYEELMLYQPENAEYFENHLAILIAQKNLEAATTNFDILKETFPDSKNISLFEEDINKLTEELENAKESETQSEENSNGSADDASEETDSEEIDSEETLILEDSENTLNSNDSSQANDVSSEN